LQMLTELVVAAEVVAFDGGVLDGAVHPVDLTFGSEMVGLGESLLDAVFEAYLVEAMDTVTRGLAIRVLREICELNAVVGKDRMEPAGNGFEQRFKE
jgi:hypothetical protein